MVTRGPGRMSGSDLLFATVVIAVGLVGVGLWAGGQLSSLLTGHGWAPAGHRRDPRRCVTALTPAGPGLAHAGAGNLLGHHPDHRRLC